jgi:hypothetical protein
MEQVFIGHQHLCFHKASIYFLIPKVPLNRACAKIGGLMETNSFSENFNYGIL